jgi:AcrR family transcriptional regulator
MGGAVGARLAPSTATVRGVGRAAGPEDTSRRARDRRRSGERRDERRAELLDAAVGAVRSYGPTASMERLAAAGGVTKPILYRHFGDRDGLISAIADRFAGELLDEILQPLQAGQLEPRDQLVATVGAYVAFVEREPNLYRFLMQQAAGRSEGQSHVSDLVETVAKQVAVVIGERMRTAGVDSGPAVAWSYGIIGLVHQAVDWWLVDRTLPRDRLVAYLTDLLWEGMPGAAAKSVADQSPAGP